MFPSIYFAPDYFIGDYFVTVVFTTPETVSSGGGGGTVGTFRFKANRATIDAVLNRVSPYDSKEKLTGLVQDQEASDIEERFARALDKYNIPYDFQVSKLAPYNTAGEYRLDFLVDSDWGLVPVAIDGEYAHKTAAQKEKDQLKDFEFMAKTGNKYEPVERISFEYLMTQEDANEYVEEHYA